MVSQSWDKTLHSILQVMVLQSRFVIVLLRKLMRVSKGNIRNQYLHRSHSFYFSQSRKGRFIRYVVWSQRFKRIRRLSSNSSSYHSSGESIFFSLLSKQKKENCCFCGKTKEGFHNLVRKTEEWNCLIRKRAFPKQRCDSEK